MTLSPLANYKPSICLLLKTTRHRPLLFLSLAHQTQQTRTASSPNPCTPELIPLQVPFHSKHSLNSNEHDSTTRTAQDTPHLSITAVHTTRCISHISRMPSSSAVTLTTSGFLYEGCEHAYDQVTSLYFYNQITQFTVFLIPARSEHKAELHIHAEGCPKPIKIQTEAPLNFLVNKSTALENSAKSVIALYHELAKRTFKFRLQRYVAMIEKHGYFFYDNKKIFADGRVSDGDRQINLNTDRPICRMPFLVYYQTQKTLGQKLLNLVKLQDFFISTTHDADVFLFLLDSLFGLRWL